VVRVFADALDRKRHQSYSYSEILSAALSGLADIGSEARSVRSEVAARRDEMLCGEPPDQDWKWVPAFLGFPVKIEDAGLSCYPWLTWGTAMAIPLTRGLAFLDLDRVIDFWGFVPAHPWRYAGLTSKRSCGPTECFTRCCTERSEKAGADRVG